MAVNDEIFCKRMTHEMKKRNMSVNELSIRTNIAETVLRRMMEGRPQSRTDKHQAIATALGISSGYLVGEHNDKNGPIMTGRRLCMSCGKDIAGGKLKCSVCAKGNGVPNNPFIWTEKNYDHLPGTMRETVEIERLGREHGGDYGKYAPIYDGRSK